MQDIAKSGINFLRACAILAVAVTTSITIVSWAFGYTGKIDRVVENDTRQDERLAKIETWQEKANEAIITTPIKLDTIGKSVTEIRQDMKAYLITR